jgi:hypothetical protein
VHSRFGGNRIKNLQMNKRRKNNTLDKLEAFQTQRDVEAIGADCIRGLPTGAHYALDLSTVSDGARVEDYRIARNGC